MRHPLRLMTVVLVAAAFAGTAPAQERPGVVLMHGKQSAPDEHRSLAEAIAAAGYPVETPEMCWSARRIYDRPYLDCLGEIDRVIARLRERGATAFVVAGHSLGASGALGYAARHPVKGVVALAPGHRPEALSVRPQVIESLGRARRLIAEGRGGTPAPFADFNGDMQITVTATPAAYLSFFAPDSPALMPANAARLTAPLLMVVGSGDPLQRGPDEIFSKVSPHPLNRYATVRAGHFDTSEASAETVVGWLRALSRPLP